MDGITFVFNAAPAAPVSANLTAESAGNWTNDGTGFCTYSRSTDFAHSGTYSHKFYQIDVGSASAGYGYLPSANNTTFTVGLQYVIWGWAYATSAGRSFYVKTGGVTSDAIALTNGSWILWVFAFTATSATTNLQVWGDDVVTFYLDDLSVREGLHFPTPRMVKGFDEPDDIERFPGLQHEYLDGGLEDQGSSFRRRISVNLGVVSDSTTRKAFLKWLIYNSRTLNYGTETGIAVVLDEPGGWASQWKNNMQLGKVFSVVCRETSVRTTWPT